MLSSSQKSHLRFLAITQGMYGARTPFRTYSPAMLTRLKSISEASRPNAGTAFMRKFRRRLLPALALAVLVPVVLIFALALRGGALSPQGMFIALVAGGIALGAALLWSMGPAFTNAAAATDTGLRLAPLAERPGDAEIIARARKVSYAVAAACAVLFAIVGAVLYAVL